VAEFFQAMIVSVFGGEHRNPRNYRARSRFLVEVCDDVTHEHVQNSRTKIQNAVRNSWAKLKGRWGLTSLSVCKANRCRSRQQLMNHPSMNVGQANVAAAEAVDQTLVVKPKLMQDRRVDVVHG